MTMVLVRKRETRTSLETYTLNRNTLSKKLLNETQGRLKLGSCIFEVVFVEIEFCSWVRGIGSFECDVDVIRAKGIIEDVSAVGSVVIEGF
jgi:hypothetical protein